VVATVSIAKALDWDELRKSIHVARQPVAFAFAYQGQAHMVVAYGYFTVGAQRFVLFRNPLPLRVGASSAISYEEYAGTPITHYRDYYLFHRQP
jgi:hypothetical protein